MTAFHCRFHDFSASFPGRRLKQAYCNTFTSTELGCWAAGLLLQKHPLYAPPPSPPTHIRMPQWPRLKSSGQKGVIYEEFVPAWLGLCRLGLQWH